MRFNHVVLSCLVLVLAGLLKTDDSGNHNTADIQPYLNQLDQGDLIFRRGRSAESYAVLAADQYCQYSHVGMVVFEKGILYVIHAVPGENGEKPAFIKKERISEFLDFPKAARYAVYRSDYDAKVRAKAARTALDFYRRKLLFDNGYDLASDDKLYCTELVIKALQHAGLRISDFPTTEINLLFARKKLILPGNITEDPHFYKLLNF